MAEPDFPIIDYSADYGDGQPYFEDRQLATLKIPPHSIQAEQSVLGGLMLDNETWDKVADRLGEEDFYRRDHQLIFRSIRMLAEKQSPFDVVTLAEVLENFGWLGDAGGLAYLGAMAKDTPSAANIVAYADIVQTVAEEDPEIEYAAECFFCGGKSNWDSAQLHGGLGEGEKAVLQHLPDCLYLAARKLRGLE